MLFCLFSLAAFAQDSCQVDVYNSIKAILLNYTHPDSPAMQTYRVPTMFLRYDKDGNVLFSVDDIVNKYEAREPYDYYAKVLDFYVIFKVKDKDLIRYLNGFELVSIADLKYYSEAPFFEYLCCENVETGILRCGEPHETRYTIRGCKVSLDYSGPKSHNYMYLRTLPKVDVPTE